MVFANVLLRLQSVPIGIDRGFADQFDDSNGLVSCHEIHGNIRSQEVYLVVNVNQSRSICRDNVVHH